MILAVDHFQITIPKGREEEARQFYCGLLGLLEVPKPSELMGSGGFWLQVGDRQVHVGTEDGIDREKTKAHVAYLVEDLEAAFKTLTARGIDIDYGVQIHGLRRFEFRDPFGNRVEFLQRL